ncbi:MAG TPA: helix-turn-helix domain-containing protein [Ignavibacteriaceae bacterium]|nr:helix-turn-helix domain-containing protein [Ignavibacteriaceae bacterium]
MEKLIDKLRVSGLTKREAHIYLALLQKKELTASEVAAIIPIGRTKIYEVIPQLVARGFCNEIQKDGKKMYRAVEPKAALKNLRSGFQEELEEIFRKKEQMLIEKIDAVSELENKLEDIYSRNSQKSDGLNYIDVIKDINQIRNKWIELQKNTKEELLAFNKAPYSIKHNKNAPHQERLLKRHIKERGIFEYGSFRTREEKKEFLGMVEMYAGFGEECRVIKELPMKLVIIDEKITMLALDDPVSMQPSITTMVISHPSFARAQKQVFESFWKISRTLKDFKKRF